MNNFGTIFILILLPLLFGGDVPAVFPSSLKNAN